MTVDPDRNPTTSDNNIFSLVGILVDPFEGLLEFRPLYTDVDHVGRFWYDIQMTDEEGHIRTIIKAKFQLNQNITK